MSKKTAIVEWIGDRLKEDPRLAREVDRILSEMRLTQDRAALREKRRLGRSQVAKRSGTGRRRVAKLEPARIPGVRL